MEKLTISAPDSLAEAFKSSAKAKGLTYSALLRILLAEEEEGKKTVDFDNMLEHSGAEISGK